MKILHRVLAGALLACASFLAIAADPKEPFIPRANGCKTLSVTASSAATALAYPDAQQAMVYSAGSDTAFIEFCTSSTCTAAVATSYPTASGHKEVLGLRPGTTHVAAIAASSTATVYVCVGVGV